MRKFGEYCDLSAEVVGCIEQIIEKIEQLQIEDISIYYGYPLIELDRQESVMKGCIVSRKGIIALYEIEAEKNIYTVRRHIVGGTNRTLFSVNLPLRLCCIGTCRRLPAG